MGAFAPRVPAEASSIVRCPTPIRASTSIPRRRLTPPRRALVMCFECLYATLLAPVSAHSCIACSQRTGTAPSPLIPCLVMHPSPQPRLTYMLVAIHMQRAWTHVWGWGWQVRATGLKLARLRFFARSDTLRDAEAVAKANTHSGARGGACLLLEMLRRCCAQAAQF